MADTRTDGSKQKLTLRGSATVQELKLLLSKL
jgi:hypothetical protein